MITKGKFGGEETVAREDDGGEREVPFCARSKKKNTDDARLPIEPLLQELRRDRPNGGGEGTKKFKDFAGEMPSAIRGMTAPLGKSWCRIMSRTFRPRLGRKDGPQRGADEGGSLHLLAKKRRNGRLHSNEESSEKGDA